MCKGCMISCVLVRRAGDPALSQLDQVSIKMLSSSSGRGLALLGDTGLPKSAWRQRALENESGTAGLKLANTSNPGQYPCQIVFKFI